MGLTDEVLSKIEQRQAKKESNQTSTELYQAASTMKEYHMTPFEWRRLSRLDRKILIYTRVMEQHFMDTMHEDHERKRELERERQKLMDNMPKQMIPRR